MKNYTQKLTKEQEAYCNNIDTPRDEQPDPEMNTLNIYEGDAWKVARIVKPQKTLLGYEVTATGNTGKHEVKYLLKGKRATYRLVIHSPENGCGMGMYALNSVGNVCAIKGNYSFSDKSGTLIAIS